MKRFALLGQPLGHSLSPILHKAIYRQLEMDDADYRAIELPSERLRGFFSGFRVGGFDGVNVTIPHKADVIPLLDEIDSKAKLINAVNCISRRGNILAGYNTDMLGFAHSLRSNKAIIEGNEFAILGAGGSAQAVGAVLAEGGAKKVWIVNRSQERAEQLSNTIATLNAEVAVDIIEESALAEVSKNIHCIINTTPLGMHPETAASPISNGEAVFNDGMLVFDLVYNPEKTTLLKQAEKCGANIANGIEMLVAQAVYSVEIWLGGNVIAHTDLNILQRELEKALK